MAPFHFASFGSNSTRRSHLTMLNQLDKLDSLILELTNPPVSTRLRNQLALTREQIEAYQANSDRQEETLSRQVATISERDATIVQRDATILKLQQEIVRLKQRNEAQPLRVKVNLGPPIPNII